jgi:hypothetical protein
MKIAAALAQVERTGIALRSSHIPAIKQKLKTIASRRSTSPPQRAKEFHDERLEPPIRQVGIAVGHEDPARASKERALACLLRGNPIILDFLLQVDNDDHLA